MDKSNRFSNILSLRNWFCSSTGRSLAVVHVNIRSLRKYWAEFQSVVNCLDSVVDVFVLTEINLSNISTEQFSLPGFVSHFYTRPNGRGGGIAVYVRKEWGSLELNVSFSCAECLALRLYNGTTFLSLLAIYRPPSGNVQAFLSELKVNLNTSFLTDQLCMIGDFNIDVMKPEKGAVCDYLTLLSEYGIECAVQTPTREEMLNDRLVTSCIDHVNIRTSDAVAEAAVVEHRLADHYFVAYRLLESAAPGVASVEAKEIEFIDNGTLDKFIQSCDWDEFLKSVDCSNAYNKFVSIFSSFMNQSRRKRYVRRRRSDQGWLTVDILEAIKFREVLWQRCRRSPGNSLLRSEYVCERNRVSALIRSAKRRYVQNKFFESRFHMAKTWSLVNEFRGVSNKYSIDALIESNFGSDASSVVTAFNDYFSTCSGVARDNGVVPRNLSCPTESSAYLPRMSEEDLRIILFSFDSKKSPGYDGIRISDLRRNFHVLQEVLLFIINGFLLTGTIPEELKTAVVKPLHKGGARNVIENYRPISILPVLMLVLEKHLLKAMNGFLEKFNILSITQHGFVTGRGTQSLLEDLSDLLYDTFENNQFACALFLDVRKAFDTLSHKVLLGKIFDAGFRGPFFALLKNFLTHRSQLVSVCNARSPRVYLKSGVPQGSILSPVLFNIYVNDMSCGISNTNIFQYADDTLLVSKHVSYCAAVDLLQSDATRILDWFQSNFIDINIDKTKLICFRSPLKALRPNIPVFLHPSGCTPCQCAPVDYVNSTRYLGIFFDSDLSWNSQMAYVSKRLRSVSCLLYNTRALFPFSVRRLVLNSLAYSVLRYGITIFAHCSNRWHTKINSILRNGLRSVAYNTQFHSSDNIFSDLSLPTFMTLFRQTVALKYYWSSSFKVSRCQQRPLRSNIRFMTPRVYTNYGKYRRSFYVPDVFNNLDENMFGLTSRAKIKKALMHCM